MASTFRVETPSAQIHLGERGVVEAAGFAARLGLGPRLRQVYRHALNGFAAELLHFQDEALPNNSGIVPW